MCLTIFSPDIWPGEGFSYCLRICSGATRILTEWSPSLYRDDALSIPRPMPLVHDLMCSSFQPYWIAVKTTPRPAARGLGNRCHILKGPASPEGPVVSRQH